MPLVCSCFLGGGDGLFSVRWLPVVQILLCRVACLGIVSTEDCRPTYFLSSLFVVELSLSVTCEERTLYFGDASPKSCVGRSTSFCLRR